jgi:hypothetical protein
VYGLVGPNGFAKNDVGQLPDKEQKVKMPYIMAERTADHTRKSPFDPLSIVNASGFEKT